MSVYGKKNEKDNLILGLGGMLWLYVLFLLFSVLFIKAGHWEINGGGLKSPQWLICSPARRCGKCWVLLKWTNHGKLFIPFSCNYFDRAFKSHFKLWDRFISDST